jgi:hypothetical protein
MRIRVFTITIYDSRSKKDIVLFTLNRAKVEEVCNMLVPKIDDDVVIKSPGSEGKSRLLIEQFIEEIKK